MKTKYEILKNRNLILLFICIVLTAILWLPRFNKQPIEFQSEISRYIIEILFLLSFCSFFILIPYFIKNRLFKVLSRTLSIIIVFIFGITNLLFILWNSGNTYQDFQIFYNQSDVTEKMYYQCYNHGAFGESYRLIKAKEIIPGIRYIWEPDDDEKIGKWDIYYIDGTYDRTEEFTF